MLTDNAINSRPTCAEPGLLNHVLRDQFNFTGFVVSDYDAWVFMAIRDGPKPFAANVSEAARLGIQAGMDQEGGGNACVSMLPALVANGTVNASAVSTAFRRLLRVRLRLGMLDPPTHVRFNQIQVSTAFPSITWLVLTEISYVTPVLVNKYCGASSLPRLPANRIWKWHSRRPDRASASTRTTHRPAAAAYGLHCRYPHRGVAPGPGGRGGGSRGRCCWPVHRGRQPPR